jgi:hypothetical protein
MNRLVLSRRRLLSLGGVAASAHMLAGCDQLDFIGRDDSRLRPVFSAASSLTYRVQRVIVGDALAPEFAESEIR